MEGLDARTVLPRVLLPSRMIAATASIVTSFAIDDAGTRLLYPRSACPTRSYFFAVVNFGV